LMYRDETLAFAMFASLIKHMELSNLYMRNVTLLKTFLYQLNRLIAVYLPTLHSHLSGEGVTAMYFGSAWFITYFIYVLQYSKSVEIPSLLLAILDRFMFVNCFMSLGWR